MSELNRFFATSNLKKIHAEQSRKSIPPLALFNQDLIGRHIVCDGFYEIDYLRCLSRYVFPKLPHRNICLDIGANVGNHSAYFSHHFQKVKSFEPNLRAFKLLEANAMLFDNIECLNFGLSNTEGTAVANYKASSIGAASISVDRKGEFTAECELKRLDDVLSEDEKSDVSFIKIDVEGHEVMALEGATETLAASSPLIVFEVLASEIRNGIAPAKQYLEDLGYAFFYEFVDTAPLASKSPALARLYNAASVIFRDRKILDHFMPKLIEGPLQSKQYAMIIAARHKI